MSWPYEQFEPRIFYNEKSKSWVCRVRPREGAEFRSLEGPRPPLHGTPDEALAAAQSHVQALQGAREESLAVEAIRLLAAGRLTRATIEGDDGPLRWKAQHEDGTWTDPHLSPLKAVKIALER